MTEIVKPTSGIDSIAKRNIYNSRSPFQFVGTIVYIKIAYERGSNDKSATWMFARLS